MATLYKILILCVGVALSRCLWAQSHGNSVQTDTNPLKIECDPLGAVYYWIENSALDLARIDYSDLYNGDHNGGVIFCDYPFIWKVQSNKNFIVLHIRTSNYSSYEQWYVNNGNGLRKVQGERNAWIE